VYQEKDKHEIAGQLFVEIIHVSRDALLGLIDWLIDWLID